MSRRVVSLLVMLSCLVISALPAIAQSTNATPVLIDTGKPLDPTTVPVAADADKKVVTNYLATIPTVPGGNSVLTASANMVGVSWFFGSAANPSSIADAARVALEVCEYFNKAPCFILSINGHDARGPDGAWPAQPEMLVKTPGSKFDPWTMPFNSQFNRGIAGGLGLLPAPEAVVISTGSGWSSGAGKTILEAIDTAFASCAKLYPTNICVLYSVNGTVVMTQ